eukprot:Phypoly_transcript_10939.p2 GENE.Phypoly_transcript_10939~~Phypoly_transcript_10939.p2  ORF type:complete len:128 (+),score=21.91 Phypoly_transcript_10939:743-1126(+)
MSANKDSVDYLLRNGAEINAVNMAGANALYYAVQGDPDKYDMVATLLKAGAKQFSLTGEAKSTPLHAHVDDFDCSLPIVKLLVENGADLSALDGNGWTARRCADFRSKTEIVEYLTERMLELGLPTE